KGAGEGAAEHAWGLGDERPGRRGAGLAAPVRPGKSGVIWYIRTYPLCASNWRDVDGLGSALAALRGRGGEPAAFRNALPQRTWGGGRGGFATAPRLGPNNRTAY